MAAAGLVLAPQAGAAAQAPTTAQAPAGTRVTDFGMEGSAYGTRARGGAVPANSGRTAWAYLGCTRLAGLDRLNNLAGVNLDGLQVDGIDSSARTYRRNGALHSKAVNEIVSAQLGTLQINGIRAVSDTWHNASGFHSTATATIADITVGGVPMNLDNVSNGDVVDIPGLATLTFFNERSAAGPHSARSTVRTLKIEITATGTSVLLGNTFAKIRDGFATGILGGQGRSVDGSALDDAATTGKAAVQPLPCQGTDGEWITNLSAGVTVPDLVHIGAATASARGNQRDRTHGYAQTRGRVARVTLGPDNDLVIKGVVGAANVTKRGDELVKSAKGTHVLSITFQGDEMALPTPGDPTKIPGLAIITTPRVDKTKTSITVVALRVELLPGTNTILNLGRARATLRPY